MRGDITIGSQIGRYRIDAPISRGGMGVVYRATDVGLERRVALKVISPELASNQGFRERFRRESKIAAGLDHPNVIPVYEAGEGDGVLFLAMRFIDGTDLQDVIDERAGLEPLLAARLTAQLGGALDTAHAAGLVHRDVKPANVLVTGGPGQEHAYLTDFGIAKRLATNAAMTDTGQWMGTLDYVAPEQISSDAVDARADIYALACLLFEALTGEVPYPRENESAKLHAHLHEDPPSVRERAAGLPDAFEQVIGRGMAKAPDERYASASDLGRAALAALDGARPSAPERTVAAGAAAPAVAAAPTVAATAPGAEAATPVLERQARDDVTPRANGAPPRRSPRRVLALALAALGLVALIAAGVAALAGDDGRADSSNVPTQPVGDNGDGPPPDPGPSEPSEPSRPTEPTGPSGAVSESEARSVVERFADAYASQDVDAVLGTLTPDAAFEFESAVTGPVTKEGRDELRSEFEGQFAGSEGYELTIEELAGADGATTVSGSYTQSVSGVPTSGTVSFDVVSEGDAALIDTLRSRPATP